MRRRRPVSMWIGVGIALLGLLGGGAFFTARLPGTLGDIDDLHRASAGMPVTFTVDEPVSWTIFREPSSASLARTQVVIRDSTTREEISLTRADASFTYAWGSRSGRPVAGVSLPAGDYEMHVVGSGRFAIGPNPGVGFFRTIVWTLAIGLPLMIGGAAVAVVSAVRDTRRRTQEAEPPPLSPWSAGEWPQEPNR